MRAIARSPVDGGLRGEPLVRGHVLGQAEQLRCERLLRERDEPPVLDARGNLHHVVVGEAGERPGVPQIHLVHDVVARDQRSHEARGGLAVEGAAALLEQRRLLVQRRVAIELEQASLDLGDDLRARRPFQLPGQDRVVAVEVLEVGRRDDAELLEQLPRQGGLLRDRVAVRGHQLREHVAGRRG